VVAGHRPAAFFAAAFSLAVAVSLAACKSNGGKPGSSSAAAGGSGRAEAGLAAEGPSCRELRERLCDQFGPGSEECQMAVERTRAFPEDRCLAMLSRYDEMATAAARLVEGRKALVSPNQPTRHGQAPTIGDAGAPITMVLFADFDSPECSRGAPIATVIRNRYPGKVRLVFRQFPLAGNADSHLAAEAALAAHAQGKFWPFYEVMFGNEQNHGREALSRYAKEAGLDVAAFDRALARHEFAADVDDDRDLGKKIDVAGVPALFVNGKHVEFPYGPTELEQVIADATPAAR
jgi:protein-disulfide isomerase